MFGHCLSARWFVSSIQPTWAKFREMVSYDSGTTKFWFYSKIPLSRLVTSTTDLVLTGLIPASLSYFFLHCPFLWSRLQIRIVYTSFLILSIIYLLIFQSWRDTVKIWTFLQVDPVCKIRFYFSKFEKMTRRSAKGNLWSFFLAPVVIISIYRSIWLYRDHCCGSFCPFVCFSSRFGGRIFPIIGRGNFRTLTLSYFICIFQRLLYLYRFIISREVPILLIPTVASSMSVRDFFHLLPVCIAPKCFYCYFGSEAGEVINELFT